MQRWHLTLGLVGSAVIAIAIAPRLLALTQAPPAPAPEPAPIAPVVVPVPPAPAPHSTGNLVISAGLDRSAVLENTDSERFLAITVRAPADLGEEHRRPVDLAVVMDGSGSMSARGKIDYAKRAAKQLAEAMEPGDLYSLVVFNDSATTVVPVTSIDGNHTARIHRAIDRIYEGGGTNLHAGMESGARGLTSSLQDAAVGRLVLLSDGNANVGITDPDALARYAAGLASQGVTVSAVGLGLDYNEDLLARIADLGGGTYDFVDDPRELEGVFADELSRTAAVVARDASVKLDLPDGVEILEVIGWDARRIDDGGWSVWMGDMYAGDTRKIIARVRVDGTASGELTVANVRAEYHDLVDDIRATTHTVASATVTSDASAVDSSVDRGRAIEANRAMGNWYLDMSTRAYERGEVSESRRLIQTGSKVLDAASSNFAAPELADEAEQLRALGTIYEAHDAHSAAGKHAIKSGKEKFRAAAR